MFRKAVFGLFIVLLLTACMPGEPAKSSKSVVGLSPAPQSTITFDGPRSDYWILKKGGTFVVTDKNGVSQTFTSANAFVFTDLKVNLKMGEAYTKIPVVDVNSVIELYVAYFNRVPDADGLEYWIGQKAAGMTFDQIGESFYRAGLSFSEVTGYTDSMTNTDFIKVIYRNVLGRESVDQEGLSYWNSQLSNGRATRGTLVRTILNAAHTYKGDKSYGFVADHLDNKLLVANLFSIQQGITYLSPEESIKRTVVIINAVTSSDTSGAIDVMGKVDWFFRQIDDLRTAPVPVQRTSYANTKLIALSDPNLPRPIDVGIMPSTVSSPFPWFQGGSGAFADFFQEGAYSAVVQLTQWRDGNTTVPVNAPSRIYFLRRSLDGKWSDMTPKILTDSMGCISPRKAVVADFNGDKKPDVFYACHGYDGEPTDANRPPYGDNQRILLSQIDGTYKNIKLPFVGYGHGASAADLNGDGFPDLVVTNTIGNSSAGYDNPLAVTNGIPYVLINRGDGSFYLDLDRLPKAMNSDVTTLQYWGIYGVELIDTKGDGKPDLFIGGLPESFANGCKGCARNGIMYNDGTGHFDKRPMEFFTTFQNATGKYFGGALDFVYDNGFLYFHHEAVGAKPQEIAVRKFKLSDMSVSTIYTHVGTYRDGQVWPTWIKPDGKGNMTSRELGCVYPIASDSVCGIIFKQ